MIKINEEKMFYDMADNQAIVINHITGMYYGFNMLGSYVIDQFINGSSEDSIATELKKCSGCPDDINSKIDLFKKELLKLEIVVENTNEKSSKDAVAVPKAALEDGFELKVEEFAEAADLILADPVHDVEEGSGWPIMKE